MKAIPRRPRRIALTSDPYSFVHGRTQTDAGEGVRLLTISFDENDDIVSFAVSLPSGDEYLGASATRSGQAFRVVVTDLRKSSSIDGREPVEVEHHLVATSQGELVTTRVASSWTARLWNVLKWEDAMSPYLRAEWDLRFTFKDQLPTVLTFEIPHEYGPASLQGNHALAHPSQRQGTRRLVRLQYSSTHVVATAGCMTKTGARPEPWTSLARGSLLVLFGVILSLFRHSSLAGQQGQLLLSALAGLGAFGATELGLFESAIYLTSKRPLRFIQTGAVLVSVSLFAATSAVILLADRISALERLVLVLAATIEMLAGAAGLYLHRKGYWSGYQCDICRARIKLRRGHQECFVSGRVPCERDITTICRACPHFEDLGQVALRTLGEYDGQKLPCAR